MTQENFAARLVEKKFFNVPSKGMDDAFPLRAKVGEHLLWAPWDRLDGDLNVVRKRV
jgi:hypothetical protein